MKKHQRKARLSFIFESEDGNIIVLARLGKKSITLMSLASAVAAAILAKLINW